MADEIRSSTSGNFYFQLDGVKCGFLKAIKGGAITAEVINEAVGATYFTKKHIGQPKYEDFSMDIGMSMSKAVYAWIEESWKMNYQRKNGAVVACDHKLNATSQREFFNALITEVTVPKLDGGGKDPAYLTVKFAPEYTRMSKASGKATGELGKSENKLWLPSMFRLELPGLDCSKVNSIDAITVKQTAVQDDLGDARDMLKEPGKLEFPNLKITLSERTAESWEKYFDEFVIKGNCDESQEKTGAIHLLSPNRQDTLATISLYNVGIFKFTHDDSTANEDKIRRCTAEMYCERMEFKYENHVAA